MFKPQLNRIVLIGQVTEKPILRYVPTGAPVCTFMITVFREKLDTTADENQVDVFPIVAWKDQAIYCHRVLKKGDWVFCEGSMQLRSFGESTGQKRTEAQVLLKDIYCLHE